MRKQYLRWLLVLCLLLTGCGREESVDTDWTAVQMAEAIAAEQPGLESPHWLRSGDSDFARYLSAVYQLDTALVEDGAVAAAGGTSASEVAVLVMADEAAARAAARALEAYREAREGDFTGYVPEEAAVAENGKVVTRGRYAALLLCADPEAARDAFARCFDGTPPPEGGTALPAETSGTAQEPDPGPPADSDPGTTPDPDTDIGSGADADPGTDPDAGTDAGSDTDAEPGTDPDAGTDPGTETAPQPNQGMAPDTYDAAAVAAAWRSGDSAGLSEKNRAILEGCAQVIAERITDGMTPVEKELAIHDWMIGWAEYDPGELDQAWVEPNPDNDNPYGFLYGRVGICLGYARTFQLFMDLLDIPCVTVEGTAHAGTEAHAWNLVELDGEWYAVDTTWDDPVFDYEPPPEAARLYAHTYFNVTSDFLRWNDHQWDENAVTEATGTQYAWQG